MKVINQAFGNGWAAYNADCIDVMRGIPDNTIDYCCYSPPFADLFTYSATEHDHGNCKSFEEFYATFRFAVAEQLRVLKPGRLVSFHCMNMPLTMERHGVIGLRDFRGELIRIFVEAGFIYHSEVVIWKDPVTAMQRTKALGLLHKQVVKDSCMSRQGIPDYLVTLRKPGKNPDPVEGPFRAYYGEMHEPDRTNVAPDGEEWVALSSEERSKFNRNRYSIEVWQRYADPIWNDINQSDTLQMRSVREEKDERHLCCLQLGVYRRAYQLWTNPGDTILEPYGGIGSGGVVALGMGRKVITSELKPAYFGQLVANLQAAEVKATQRSLFDDDESEDAE